MKEFLSQQGVKYDEVDVSADDRGREEMVTRSGIMAVPQVQVDDQLVVGFDRQRLEQLLH